MEIIFPSRYSKQQLSIHPRGCIVKLTRPCSALLVGAASLLAGGVLAATPQAASAASSSSTNWNMQAANSQLLKIIGSYPTPSGDTTQGITANSVKIGCTSDNTAGGAPTGFSNFCAGVKGRIQQANAAHEIPQKIELVGSYNTGGDVTQSQTDWTQLADSNKVYAVMMYSGESSSATPSVLESAHVPYFGIYGTCGKQAVFGFTTAWSNVACAALPSETSGAWLNYGTGVLDASAKYIKTSPKNVRYAIVTQDEGGFISASKAIASEYAKAGAKIVDPSTVIPVASATASYTPYVSQVLATKPNVIGMIIGDTATTTEMTSALFQAGFKGAMIGAYSASEMQNPTVAAQINGALATSGGWGFPVFGGSDWAVVDKAAKSEHVPLDQGFEQGWLAADQFIQGMKDVEKTHKVPSTEQLTSFMNNGWIYPGYGDVIAPTIFPLGKYAAPPCSAVSEMSAAKKGGLPSVDLLCGTEEFTQLSG